MAGDDGHEELDEAVVTDKETRRFCFDRLRPSTRPMACPRLGVLPAKHAANDTWQPLHAVVRLALCGDLIDLLAGEGLITLSHRMKTDVAPNFYPALSSLRRLDLPCWAWGAAGADAEPFMARSVGSRRGRNVEAKAVGVCHPSFECGRAVL